VKNFRANLIVRIFSIALFLFISLYLYFEKIYFLFLIVLAAIIIFQVLSLIKYVDRTNKELVNFLQSIKYSDYSQNFSFGSLGKSFKELTDEFNNIFDRFKQLRNEKEESLNYLQTVVEHVGVGLIAFDDNGDVGLINRTAKKMLGIKNVKNILSLNSLSKNFGDFILELQENKKIVYQILVKDEITQLLLYSTKFTMRNRIFKLVALQNILPELEEKEIEAYQKLIRVLTHEIMNSVTPISSLASTANELFSSVMKKENGNNPETLEDIFLAISTIQKRSEGLVNFVNKYRSLTKIPKPRMQIVHAHELLNRIRLLMETAFESGNISFYVEVGPDNLEFVSDPELLEQVLINLLNNSIQSFDNSAERKIVLKIQIDERSRIMVKIIDNGPGISQEVIDKIFIPFFSTKKDGSGIGLSLSQQIIRSLGGTISATSEPNVETVFTIRL